MAVAQRDIRKILNTKQDSSDFVGIPSVSSMLDGQTSIQKESNSQVAIYKKKFGKLWKSYMSSNGDQYVDKNINVGGRTKSKVTAKDLIFEKGLELTIASGVITTINSFHTVDVESSSSDNLDTINGGSNGQILILKPASASRTIVIRHDEGNIITSDGSNFSMEDGNDTAVLFKDGSKWFVLVTINAQ